MYWFLGILALLVLFIWYRPILGRLGLLALSIVPPAPLAAAPKRAQSCGVPNDPATLQALNANTTGGVMRAQAIQVPAGLQLKLTSSLILVANGQLTVDGTITMDPANAPPGAVIDIVLVSLSANVVVGAQAVVGQTVVQPAAPAPVAGAVAAGSPGTNGGSVKIVAVQASIDIKGVVEGFGGSDGGSATATGVAGIAVFGGEAVAVGGQSGAGGDVKLCAYESINVSGKVRAGLGGQGGNAVANAVNGKDAYAEGGSSNIGGDVLIDGLHPNMQVFNTGSIEGGPVLFAGTGTAAGGIGSMFGGGDATAVGGKGKSGGTVIFTNCFVVPPVGQINCRVGGDGGWATARGGAGASPGGPVAPFSGGDATATGGSGGKPGATPTIPTQQGPVQGGVSRGGASIGTGGTANATGGPGGSGAPLPAPAPALGRGGNSGTATATGGTGAGGTAAPTKTSPAVGPTGMAGGVCAPAPSPGTP